MSCRNNKSPGLPQGSDQHRERTSSGNMLVLVTAVTVGIIAVIAYFSLAYVRLLGSNNEQKTAIEAAALAAGRDLSKIVIDTPEFGLVSLSDSAPTGTNTAANDKYYIPVRSINSLVGTIRRNLIIADKMGDTTLKAIAKADVISLNAVETQLNTELQNDINKGNTGKDVNGNTVDVYGDAEKAYQQNQVRMTGSSSYVAGSLKLSLGTMVNGTATNTPVPQPSNWANVPNNAQQNNFYRSYVNVPYDGQDFMLAGIGDNVKLVDSRNWQAATDPPDAPFSGAYAMPTIIKAEATQSIVSNQTDHALTVQNVACAQPANIADPRPAPGALTFSFPDGICPEIPKPYDILKNAALNQKGNCTYQTSVGGDFPFPVGVATLQDRKWSYSSFDMSTGTVFRRALYDWWHRCGTKLNMSSAVNMFQNDPANNFVAPSPATVAWKSPAILGDPTVYNLGNIPTGSIHIYKMDPTTGYISYQTKVIEPIKYAVSGESQMYSENISAITGSSIGTFTIPTIYNQAGIMILDKAKFLNAWDIYIRDQTFQLGGLTGGGHAGEPMDFDKVAFLKNEIGGKGMGAFELDFKKFENKHDSKGENHNYEDPTPTPAPVPSKVKGMGLPPAITQQSDFAEAMGYPNSYYYVYSVGPGAKNGLRPTYLTNGMSVDVRFRRQLDPGSMAKTLGVKTGYVGEKYGPSVPATPTTQSPPTY